MHSAMQSLQKNCLTTLCKAVYKKKSGVAPSISSAECFYLRIFVFLHHDWRLRAISSEEDEEDEDLFGDDDDEDESGLMARQRAEA